jgi:fructokinase
MTSPATGDVVVTVVGEALIDLVPAGPGGLWRAAPGGSPANVAVGLARLGVATRMGVRLAADVFGRVLRDHLTDNGVELAAVAAAEPSSLAVVSVAPDGGAEYDFRVTGTADWQWTDAELAAVLAGPGHRDAAAVHSGSLAATTAPGGAAVLRMLRDARATATVSYDPNCRPLLMGDPQAAAAQVLDLVRVADVVKASEEDLRWLYPGRPAADVAAWWAGQGPLLVAVTLGEHGALAVNAQGTVSRPGRPVAVTDTVGAGDSFTSALLAGLAARGVLGAPRREALRDLPPAAVAAVLDEAIAASALTCTRVGADPPSRAELTALLAES